MKDIQKSIIAIILFGSGLVVLQFIIVPIVFLHISNNLLHSFPIARLGLFVYNIPVFIVFLLYFYVFGILRVSTHIGYWILIGALLVMRLLTAQCYAVDRLTLITNCILIELSLVGSAWIGFYLAKMKEKKVIAYTDH